MDDFFVGRRPVATVTRRSFLRRAAILSTGAALLAACTPAPAAAPAKPTEVPKPAEAPKPAAAAPTTAAAAPTTAAAAPTTAPAAKPTQAAQAAPAQTGTGAGPKGSMVMVPETEPDTIVPKDGSTNNSYIVLDNVYDHLVGRDISASGEIKLVPKLAESWERANPNTWRFKLRKDVKYHNGEQFTADAVVTMVQDIANPQAPGRSLTEYGTLMDAKKVDDYTVDVVTKDPDPILPSRLVKFPIPAPAWLKGANLDISTNQAIGSGPYKLAEYVKGQYLVFRANEDYWGPKPSIAEIKWVGRTEQAVRAAMLQAREAQLAFHISLDDAKNLPQTILETTQECPMFRMNAEHPVLKDVKARQAIVYSIDTVGLMNTFFPGGVAVPLNGQLTRPGSVGYNPDLKPYPYDPAQAKKLLQEIGAVGTPIEYVDRPGSYPRAGEVNETIIGWLNETGFKATIRHLEAAPWREAFLAVKPDQKRTDMQATSVSNPILDSSRAFDVYYACGGRNHIGCDQSWDDQYRKALPLEGEARNKAFQDLWARAYPEYWYMPLYGLNWVHGGVANFKWKPRIDGTVRFSEWELTS